MQTDPGKEHWQQLEEIFHAALELDAAKRNAFLDRSCGANSVLRSEAELLLNSADNSWGFFEKPWHAAARQVASGSDLGGQRIGAYEVMNLLGEGGMGKVYLARRADDLYEQKVAIKVVQTGAGRVRDLLVRFAAERQILANLAHPNIARLLDAGLTGEGSPYLVMEYIEGVPIDKYAAAHQLSLVQRLELFRVVCSAVSFAHNNLVIHRDIKPANILVTLEGVPKLLDFGIAKLVDPAGTSEGALTRATERLMTPEYASPEQARGLVVTTATDVYSLGGLLYTLLAGRPPFRVAGNDPLEIARVICEKPPTRPSATLNENNSLPAQDRKRLKGDLDNIVLKALRKEPTKRYASAADLSEDVRRYLEGFPLQAGSQAWAYRVQKFVFRHKVAVGAAVLLLLAGVGFSIAMGVLAQRARRERANAIREQQKSQQEAAFLSSLFRAATPDVERGKTITARDVLDLSAGRIHRELASQPEVRASMLNSIGDSYVALGLYPQAEPLLTETYDLRKQSAGAGTLELAQSAWSLSEVRNAQGRYKEQEALLRESLAIRQRMLGDKDPLVAQTLLSLGECLYLQSRTKEAEPVLRGVIAIGPREADNTAAAMNFLALVIEKRGASEEAAQLLRSATDTLARVQGTDSPDYLTSMHNLAGALRDMGDLDGAEATERKVLTIRQRVSGLDHPHTTFSLNMLGWILLEKGEWGDAEPYLKQAYDANRKRLGERHPRLAISLNNLGQVYEDKGDYRAAEKYYRESLSILEENKLDESWNTAKVDDNLALLATDRGDYPAAERFAQQALDIQHKLGGDRNPDDAVSLICIGLAKSLRHDSAGAEPLLRQALAIRQTAFPPGHLLIIAAQIRLGEVLMDEGKAGDAETVLRGASTSAHHSAFPLPPWQVAEADNALGACLARMGRGSEGFPLLRSSRTALNVHPQATIRKRDLARTTAILKGAPHD